MKQLQHECEAWERSLGFMIDENIHLKNRLTEILLNSEDDDVLERVEYFQSRFIKEDERISLIRNDLTELDKLLVREIFEDGIILKEINRKLYKLRNNILNAEQQFSELKTEFSKFLLETYITKN